MTFLLNIWYLAAWADEVPPGGMLGRRIAGRHVLFLRDDAGAVSAIGDMCPHRFAPLSQGTCEGGKVRCPYHGLVFDGSGQCVENPHGPIVSALTVPRWPCEERHAALWLWLGDASADPGLIPDLSYIDRTPVEARVTGRLHTDADYRLMVDNIMDLTHADYVHASSLGGGINSRAKASVEREGDSIGIEWTAFDDQLSPLHGRFLPETKGRGDFLNRVDWHAPSIMLQRVAFAPPGMLDTAPRDSLTCHVMTPETERSTHYFFCHTSDGVSADPGIAEDVRQALIGAFAGEDSPMLEAQQERIGDAGFWDMKPVLLPSDKGAVLVRRALESMIAAERGMKG